MGIFTKPEVVILKESSDAKTYLNRLEALLPQMQDRSVKEQVQREIAVAKAGIAGEENILFELKNSGMDMVVLHDIYLETADGLGAQIDFVVVTAKLVFLIECKNLFGDIEIDSKGNFVRTMTYGGKKHKEGIYSPITQNERHMTVMKECRLEDKNFFTGAALRNNFTSVYKPLVVLSNPKTIVNDRYAKKEVKEKVIRADQLIAVIRKAVAASGEISLSKKRMLALAEEILAKNKDERKDYLQKYEQFVKDVPNDKQMQPEVESEKTESTQLRHDSSAGKIVGACAVACPKCGARLLLRTAKKGNNAGQQFYGCSNFPKCRFVLNIESGEQNGEQKNI